MNTVFIPRHNEKWKQALLKVLLKYNKTIQDAAYFFNVLVKERGIK